jgi:hypothetical protein
MTSRRNQNWPVVPDRRYCADRQPRPESAYALLKLRLGVAAPSEFLTPGTDGKAE